MIMIMLSVTALRRFGATPRVLKALPTVAPTTLDAAIEGISDAALAQFKAGHQPCTNAYFPATAGFNRSNAAFRIAAKFPELTPQLDGILERTG